MSNANKSKYRYFDKKYLVMPNETNVIGKKIFYDVDLTNLIESVESGDLDEMKILKKIDEDEHYSFVINKNDSEIKWSLAYFDPNYEIKVAYSQGKQIQVRFPSTDEWLDTKEPAWAEANEYRIKPVKWFVHEADTDCYYSDTDNTVPILYEGTEEECNKWIEKHTSKVRRYTNRELAKWCADSKGQAKYTTGFVLIHWTYKPEEDNVEVPADVLIREWDSDEWHEPLVEAKE